eukprot:764085-Hanusia_phi.AAC.3
MASDRAEGDLSPAPVKEEGILQQDVQLSGRKQLVNQQPTVLVLLCPLSQPQPPVPQKLPAGAGGEDQVDPTRSGRRQPELLPVPQEDLPDRALLQLGLTSSSYDLAVKLPPAQLPAGPEDAKELDVRGRREERVAGVREIAVDDENPVCPTDGTAVAMLIEPNPLALLLGL